MKTKLLMLIILLCSFSAFAQKDTIINHEQDTMIVSIHPNSFAFSFFNVDIGNFSSKELSDYNPSIFLEANLGLYTKYFEYYLFCTLSNPAKESVNEDEPSSSDLRLTMTGLELKFKPLQIGIKHNSLDFYVLARSSYFWLVRESSYDFNATNNQGFSYGGSTGLQYTIPSQNGRLTFYAEYLFEVLDIHPEFTSTSYLNDTEKQSIKFGLIFRINNKKQGQNKLYKNYEETYPFGNL